MLMRCSRYMSISQALLLGALVAGCGGEVGTTSEEGGETESSATIKRYETADLPVVADFLPPLDEGRIEVAPPEDWSPSRQKGYLVVFAKGKVADLPRITVAAVDSPVSQLGDTSEDNAADFAAALRKHYASDKKKIVREPPKPVILGGRVWLRHVRQVKADPVGAVQSLQIVRDGRLYSIEMTCDAKSDAKADIAAAVLAFRDQAYAVAANAKFPKEAGAPAAETPAEEKPAEPVPEGAPAEPTKPE